MIKCKVFGFKMEEKRLMYSKLGQQLYDIVNDNSIKYCPKKNKISTKII